MKDQPAAGEAHGPSWADVYRFMEELKACYKGTVVVEMTSASTTRGGAATGLWVRLVWHEHDRAERGAEIASGGPWPHSDHRTMPGLLYNLLHQLDRKLEEWEERSGRRARPSWPAGPTDQMSFREP